MPDRKADEDEAPISEAQRERARRLRQTIRDDRPRTWHEITDEEAQKQRRKENDSSRE